MRQRAAAAEGGGGLRRGCGAEGSGGGVVALKVTSSLREIA